jgi:exodeoxyribonuclease I
MADFFFYDLETTGISSRRDRIVQFAGIRTDENLIAKGEPYNILIKLPPDILPSPEAALITGILPAKLSDEGITEAEFSDLFNTQIAIPNTIFVGYNNLRFDDEFIRFLNYRNFYDAYQWHWKDGSSRWDLLDMVRMTRALRPDGINWPVSEEGKPTNRLELLSAANNLTHDAAHDALSDVVATIELAKLIKAKQPKLFNFLLEIRSKEKVAELINAGQPFIYTSSHYSSEFLHTSVAATISTDQKSSALVYDLRNDPQQFLDLDIAELAERWRYDPDSKKPRLPVKTIKFNRCPAIAPLSVADKDSQERLKLDIDQVMANYKIIEANKQDFSKKLEQVVKQLDKEREENRTKREPRIPTADERLYDGFIDRADQAKFPEARELASQPQPSISFSDDRLNDLFKLYRARNYENSLSDDESQEWHDFIHQKLFSEGDSMWADYQANIERLIKENTKDLKKVELLNELLGYAESIADDYGKD